MAIPSSVRREDTNRTSCTVVVHFVRRASQRDTRTDNWKLLKLEPLAIAFPVAYLVQPATVSNCAALTDFTSPSPQFYVNFLLLPITGPAVYRHDVYSARIGVGQ